MRHGTEVVVLLHGIARTRLSLRPLERFFAAAGYRTENLTYPSRRLSLDAIADWLQPRLASAWQAERVHFVTHSMRNTEAQRQTLHFLEHGRFDR